MSKDLSSERVTFLLYLDDPIQSEIIDYLIDLNRSRKGEVLREIIVMGWEKFNKEKLSKNKRKTKKIKENSLNSFETSNEKLKEPFIENNLEKTSNDKLENKISKVNNVDNNNIVDNNDNNDNNEEKIDKLNPLSSFKKRYGI